MQSCIYEGFVRHRRFTPSRHEFKASLFMMYVDLDELSTIFHRHWFWSIDRSNVATFCRRDHVGSENVSLDATIRDLVESKISSRPTGPIRMLTHFRYFGYCFNPLSLFFCFDPSGTRLHSVVAEVTNTPWGERHCYVLDATRETVGSVDQKSQNPSESTSLKNEFSFAKAFHVSPFMGMNVQYRWSLNGPGDKLVLCTENCRDHESFFDATLVLTRREINAWSLARVLVQYPFMTAQVIANIHWQALKLWWKNVPYVPHPMTGSLDGSDKNRYEFPSEQNPS